MAFQRCRIGTNRSFSKSFARRLTLAALRAAKGFLDVAHFGFVHTETFGDRANTRMPSYVPETNDVGFTVDYWSSVANYPAGSKAKCPEGFEWLRHFEVHLPFTASITVHFPHNGRLLVMNCASPRNFDKHIPVEAVHEFNRQVFEEDRRVVEVQKPEFLPLIRRWRLIFLPIEVRLSIERDCGQWASVLFLRHKVF
jgi:hypothetical protein